MNWLNIIENIIAGGVVVLVFSLLLPFWLKRFFEPTKVMIENDPKEGKKIKIKMNAGDKEFSTTLLLTNQGRATLDQAFWKILVPVDIEIDGLEGFKQEIVDSYKILGGSINHKIFPNRSVNLIKFKGKFPTDYKNERKIYFEISTQYGLYPKKIKHIYNSAGITYFNAKNLEKYGYIEFED